MNAMRAIKPAAMGHNGGPAMKLGAITPDFVP